MQVHVITKGLIAQHAGAGITLADAIETIKRGLGMS